MVESPNPHTRRSKTAGICTLILFLQFGSLLGLESDGFYLQVPYVRQTRNYCGPAVLAMLFTYWGTGVDQYELAGNFDPFPSKGLSGEQLKRLAWQYRFQAYSFRGDADFIRSQVKDGHPVIVALAGGPFDRTNHFVLLVGWDQDRSAWLVHDPIQGPFQTIDAPELEKRHRKLGFWTLLVVPAGGEG